MCTRSSQLHENHLALLEENFALNQLGRHISREQDNLDRVLGNEDFSDSLKSLGSGLFTASKWVGGKTLDALTAGFSKAGKALYATFADNEAFIQHVLSLLSKAEEKTLSVSKDSAALLTADGDPDHLRKGTDALIEALTDLNGHSKDILNYLDKQLSLIKKLKGVKTNDQVIQIIEEYEALKYPHMRQVHTVKDGVESEILPGGKIIRFEGDEKPSYSLIGDAPVGESGEVTLSKSDVSQWLSKIDKVNSLHKQTKAAYDDYLRLIKNWSDAVQDVDKALGESGWLSATTHKGVDKLLAGDATALLFYSGFMPRVVGYADRYIHGVLRLFA